MHDQLPERDARNVTCPQTRYAERGFKDPMPGRRYADREPLTAHRPIQFESPLDDLQADSALR